MTTIEFYAEGYNIPVDSDGDVVEKEASCTITITNCQPGLGFDTLTKGFVKRGSKHRTIEGKVKEDIVNRYRTWDIGWDNIPGNLYYEITKFFTDVCDENYCLKMNIFHECADNTNCDDKNVEGVPVVVDVGEAELNDAYGLYENFNLTVEESATEDCNCGAE